MKILETQQDFDASRGTYSINALVSQEGEFNKWLVFYSDLTAKEVDAKEIDLQNMSEEELNKKFDYDELEEA